MRELWQKIIVTSGTQVYSLGVGIVTLTLTSRWLGPEGRGAIAAVTTWVGLFMIVGYLSLGQVAVHHATEHRTDQWLGPILGSLLLLDLIITLIGWIVAAGLYMATAGAIFNHLSVTFLLIGFLALPLMIWEQYSSALLMAVDHVMIYNRAQMLGRTAGLLWVAAAWFFDWGVAGILTGLLVSQTLVALGGFRYLLDQAGQAVRPDQQTIKQLLAGALRLHLNYVAGFLITSASILIINYYLGAQETGYYQLAAQLTGVLAVIPQSASMIMYGRVTKLGPDAAWHYQRKMLVGVMGLMVTCSVVAAILSPWAIPLVLGSRFAPAVPLFQILLLSTLCGAVVTIMSSQWIGRGLFGLMSILTVVTGAMSLAMNFLLIPRYGALGAAWAAVGIYAVALIGQAIMAVKCESRFRHGLRLPQAAGISS